MGEGGMRLGRGGGHEGRPSGGLIGGRRRRGQNHGMESYPPPWADIHKCGGQLGGEDGADLSYLPHEVGIGS